jgi:hypothetical protein
MPKLSLIIPSIRPENWISLVADMKYSCQSYDYEIIFVGPYLPPKELETDTQVRYVRDFGCPSRALQIGASLAEGKYLAWCSDDCRIEPNGFDSAIELFDAELDNDDGMCLLYSEGADYTGTQHEQPDYWIARTHGDLKIPGVKEGWRIAPIFMYDREYFVRLGGLDCSYEHVNMNTHDLAFQVQQKGGRIFSSPTRVFKFDWQPEKKDYMPILSSFIVNDRPKFNQQYSYEDAAALRLVQFDNWRQAQAIWGRRFKT